MAVAPGTRLGPYEIISPLGAGGMGEVYRARDPRLGREVAIKVLPRDVVTDAERLRRFHQEARAAGSLNHPNLLALFDVGSGDCGPFLVSELLDGESLRDRLRARRVSPREALDWGAQIARGLSAAHSGGVVHRDLKPENVFLLKSGGVKILDFGLAKLEEPIAPGADEAATAPGGLTGAGVTLGTVGYMAPEQVRGAAVGPATDIFALGVVLYELVAGRPPFHRQTSVETLNAILNEIPAPLSSAPLALDSIIARCLEKEPKNRFRSAADVAFALDALSVAGASPRKSRWLLTALAAAGVLALLAVATTWRRGPERETTPPEGARTASRMTPFLSSAAVEEHPAWSPSGALIAYVSDDAGSDDIWIVDTSGGNPINLTQGFAGTDTWPAWSPDGHSLAFYSDRDGGGIYTMTALGGSLRRIVPLKREMLYTFSLNWARDGTLVYTAVDAEGLKRLYRVPSAGGTPVCLSCGWMTEARAGEVSPSGDYVAFVSGVFGPRADLFLAHLPTGRVRPLTNRADLPRWSPDGRHILFISNRDGPADLWQISINPADGSSVGDPRKLTTALETTTFAVAPDGKQILAVKEGAETHLWSFPLGASIGDVKTGTKLTTGAVRDRRGRWSHDGSGIYFESLRRGSFDIWRLMVVGGKLDRLSVAEGSELRPRPSPNGDWVAFDLVDHRGEFTHLMRPDGSLVHPLHDSWFSRYSQVCCADWSPDGSRLALAVSMRNGNRSSTIAIATVDRTTGTASALRVLTTLPGGAPEYGRWSPDGRFVVYEALTDGSWDLWIVDPDAPTPRRLTTFASNDRQAVWQKQPQALYFRRDNSEVWRLPFARDGSPSGPATAWLILPRGLRLAADSLSINPSDDRLVTALTATASDIWLIELQ